MSGKDIRILSPAWDHSAAVVRKVQVRGVSRGGHVVTAQLIRGLAWPTSHSQLSRCNNIAVLSKASSSSMVCMIMHLAIPDITLMVYSVKNRDSALPDLPTQKGATNMIGHSLLDGHSGLAGGVESIRQPLGLDNEHQLPIIHIVCAVKGPREYSQDSLLAGTRHQTRHLLNE